MRKRKREMVDMNTRGLLEVLPDEVWMKIFKMGIDSSILTHKDLSSLSVSCKHFNELSSDDSLWSTLLTLGFPQFDSNQHPSSSSSSKKALFKYRFELQIASDRHTILQIRSESVVITRRLKRLRCQMIKHKERLKAIRELSDAEEAEYHELFEELDTMEKRHMSIKKAVSKKHAYYKKKYGAFNASNSADNK